MKKPIIVSTELTVAKNSVSLRSGEFRASNTTDRYTTPIATPSGIKQSTKNIATANTAAITITCVLFFDSATVVS
jgi:hypothetical protein